MGPPNEKRRPRRTAVPKAADQSDAHHDTSSSVAQREASLRVHSAAVALDAVDTGTWPPEVEVIDGCVALLQAASRWQLVAELSAVT
jgi:hypothetical protein